MTVLHTGDPAPDLDLTNQSGQPVSLASFRGQSVIVYFFPEAFSPGCTEEVCDIRDNVGALTAAGFVVLGISGDSPERLAEFAAANTVNHDLLSDPGCLAARRWGAYGQKVLGGVRQDGPIRSTFVVGADGLLQSVQYHVDPRGHAAALVGSVGSAGTAI